MTALHWSAYNNTPDNVKLLLKAVRGGGGEGGTGSRRQSALSSSPQGADIAVTDVDGKTALHWTADNPDPTTAGVLLELAPSAINLRDNDGRTALHLAVASGNTPVMETLVGLPSWRLCLVLLVSFSPSPPSLPPSQTSTVGVKCDLSAVDLQFRTPLHWAAVLGSAEVVRLLVERGADPSATDAVGATPLHYAVRGRGEREKGRGEGEKGREGGGEGEGEGVGRKREVIIISCVLTVLFHLDPQAQKNHVVRPISIPPSPHEAHHTQ